MSKSKVPPTPPTPLPPSFFLFPPASADLGRGGERVHAVGRGIKRLSERCTSMCFECVLRNNARVRVFVRVL